MAKSQGQLSQSQRDHLRRIQVGSAVELMDILFASGRRSIESLLLALPTTDRIDNTAASQLIQEGVDGSIRLLGSRKRLSSHPSSSQNSVPGYVAGYLTAIAQHNGISPAVYIDDVVDHLEASGCLNTAHYYLEVNSLCVQPAGTFVLRVHSMSANPPSPVRRRLHGLLVSVGTATACGKRSAIVRLLQLPGNAGG